MHSSPQKLTPTQCNIVLSMKKPNRLTLPYMDLNLVLISNRWALERYASTLMIAFSSVPEVNAWMSSRELLWRVTPYLHISRGCLMARTLLQLLMINLTLDTVGDFNHPCSVLLTYLDPSLLFVGLQRHSQHWKGCVPSQYPLFGAPEGGGGGGVENY